MQRQVSFMQVTRNELGIRGPHMVSVRPRKMVLGQQPRALLLVSALNCGRGQAENRGWGYRAPSVPRTEGCRGWELLGLKSSRVLGKLGGAAPPTRGRHVPGSLEGLTCACHPKGIEKGFMMTRQKSIRALSLQDISCYKLSLVNLRPKTQWNVYNLKTKREFKGHLPEMSPWWERAAQGSLQAWQVLADSRRELSGCWGSSLS